MALANIDEKLWGRFVRENRKKGLVIHATLEKLISAWLRIYADEEFCIPPEAIQPLLARESPDMLENGERERPITKTLKESNNGRQNHRQDNAAIADVR